MSKIGTVTSASLEKRDSTIRVEIVFKFRPIHFGNVAVYRQELDRPTYCAPVLRRNVCERLVIGESVKSLVAELHVSEQTLSSWHARDFARHFPQCDEAS
jgi:hypothetical protein